MEFMISSEFVSDEYIHINSCDCQEFHNREAGSIRPNGRVDYHLLYISKGVVFVTIDGEEIPAGEGSVIIYKPHSPQRYRFKSDISSVSYYVHFSGTGCEELLEKTELDGKTIFNMSASRRIEKIFIKMIEEHHMQKPFFEQICAGYMIEILSLIGRKTAYNNPETGMVLNNLISNVCRKMYYEYNQNKGIEEYAAFCGLSTSRFTHVFKAVQGISPKQYIIKLKIIKARELLENTELSMNEISKIIGIEDQNYFSRFFKKHTGVSPKFYRY